MVGRCCRAALTFGLRSNAALPLKNLRSSAVAAWPPRGFTPRNPRLKCFVPFVSFCSNLALFVPLCGRKNPCLSVQSVVKTFCSLRFLCSLLFKFGRKSEKLCCLVSLLLIPAEILASFVSWRLNLLRF
jgi:hypothetical protein